MADPRATRTLADVESWEDVGVLAWGSEAVFSRLNRPAIIEFLRGGIITGKVLLALTKAELRAWDLPIGPAIELMCAIGTLKAEIGTFITQHEVCDSTPTPLLAQL